MNKDGNTATVAVASSWMTSIQWLDGWKVISGALGYKWPAVWVAEPVRVDQWLSGQYGGILTCHEIVRSGRLHQPAHAMRFKAAHAVLRTLLSRETGVDPPAVCFEKGHHNKPLLFSPANDSIGFNLSYTENTVMIGLAHHSIGVDVEWLKRPLDVEDLLQACFSTREIAFIKSCKEEASLRFYTLWTRKEAILKLTGEGIGEHLPLFEVLDGTWDAEKSVIGGQPPDHIFLYSFRIGNDFIGSIATPAPISDLHFYKL
ncbi:4'-phosphopantetheinyl transferase family protein [Parapedobacter deserti]|uniref:4'-phosphopantetheinyl transferase family protein n=1 Tax=Parapedobacter deserti TaxID=1912957 RepID=A0ABV7JJD7_9SPHI